MMTKTQYLAGAFILLVTDFAAAALPPWHEAAIKYARMSEMQNKRHSASDVVTVRIVDAKKITRKLDECPAAVSWSVEAKVEKVARGRLTKGDRIAVTFTVEEYYCPGEQQYYPKQLVENASYNVYLDCNHLHCTPAAGAWSFHDEMEFLLEYKKARREKDKWNSSQIEN